MYNETAVVKPIPTGIQEEVDGCFDSFMASYAFDTWGVWSGGKRMLLDTAHECPIP